MKILEILCFFGIHNKKKMPACFDYRCVWCGRGWNYFKDRIQVYPKDEVNNLIMQHLIMEMKNGK